MTPLPIGARVKYSAAHIHYSGMTSEHDQRKGTILDVYQPATKLERYRVRWSTRTGQVVTTVLRSNIKLV